MHVWEGIDYLLLDEISTIGVQFLEFISDALYRAKGNDFLFGNISVVFIGDFV